MLDILSYKYKLWKLQGKKEKTRKFYRKKIDDARKEKKPQDYIDGFIHEEMHFIDLIDDDITQIQYQLLTRQAERHFIPTPKEITTDGTWEQSDISGRWRLSEKALSNLKQAIRQEQKHGREHWQSWLMLVIGLIGALIGLLSVLKSD